MEKTTNTKRRSFHQLEQQMTIAVGADAALFILFLIVSGAGIGWLKFILGILTILLSAAGDGFLVLVNEHTKRRSWWLLTAFAAIALCTLVSLIVGYPAPALTVTP